MKIQNRIHVILFAIGLLLSGCDSSGGDSSNAGLIVTGDGNTVTVETIIPSSVETILPSEDESNGFPNENEINDNQNNCRIPDVFRLGFQMPDADLYLFPDSVSLPTQIGNGVRRMVQVPDGNPIFVDSLVISEIGTVSIRHVSGGPQHTRLELFDLDLENNIRSYVASGQIDEFNGRARIDFALTPGVYCITLAEAAFEAFPNNTKLTVDHIYMP